MSSTKLWKTYTSPPLFQIVILTTGNVSVIVSVISRRGAESLSDMMMGVGWMSSRIEKMRGARYLDIKLKNVGF